MLPDPIIVSPVDGEYAALANDDSLVTVAITDVAPGKTVRSGTLGGNPATLIISHQESKENKGTTTDRSLIRLEMRKQVVGIGEVKAVAQVVVAFPRVGYSSADMTDILSGLLGVLFTRSSGANSPMNIQRILDGEP